MVKRRKNTADVNMADYAFGDTRHLCIMTASEWLAVGAERLARAGVWEPRREARLLIRAMGGCDPLLQPHGVVPEEQSAALQSAFDRRCAREPFAYIVGRREFWGRDLATARGVLIPRPESETVVASVLERIGPTGAELVADIATGSGAIGLALLSAWSKAVLHGTDTNPAALTLASRNAERLGLRPRTAWFGGDLWTALPADHRGAYEVGVCNPPYVTPEEWETLDPEIRCWEPRSALVPPEGWQAIYTRVAAGGRCWLRQGGLLAVEVGAATPQAEAVRNILIEHGFRDVWFARDLAGQLRVVGGWRL